MTEIEIDSMRLGDEVIDAARRLGDHVHRTPVTTSYTLDRRCGASVFLKCENLQRTGAFKFRGAFNALSRLTEAERARGVITHSSGNHAQALACAGKMLGIAVTVVMPDNAPRVKRAATEGYGAEVIGYDPERITREELSAQIGDERNLTLIPPYDHPDIICGQGTAALEMLSQADRPDMLLVPTGGAGLLSGTALACFRHAPGCRVIGVEPELADDATRSFRTRTLQTVKNPPTIADGVRTPSLGEWTFPLVLRHVADMVTVSEEAIREAVAFLLIRTKMLVEPSGALGVAALLSGAVEAKGNVGVILSGGNVDPETLADLLG